MTLPTWGATAAFTVHHVYVTKQGKDGRINVPESYWVTISVSANAACTFTGNSGSSRALAIARKFILRFYKIALEVTQIISVKTNLLTRPRHLRLRHCTHHFACLERRENQETLYLTYSRLTIALKYASWAPNSGVTNCITKASMLFLTSGWRIIHGPSAAVMFRAPNFWGGAADLA